MKLVIDSIENYSYNFYMKVRNKLNKRDFNHYSNISKENSKKLFLLGRYIIYQNINNKCIEYNINGKPFSNDFNFSISHYDKYVVFILCRNNVGIDIFKINDFNKESSKYFCNKSEVSLINSNKEYAIMWSLKESYIKMYGGNSNDYFNIEFYSINNSNILCNKECFFNYFFIDNYIISYCMEKNN